MEQEVAKVALIAIVARQWAALVLLMVNWVVRVSSHLHSKTASCFRTFELACREFCASTCVASCCPGKIVAVSDTPKAIRRVKRLLVASNQEGLNNELYHCTVTV